MLVDVHSHIYRAESNMDIERMVRRAREAEVLAINCCHNSSNSFDVEKTIELAKKYDNIFSAFGLYYFGGERLDKLKMRIDDHVLKQSQEVIRKMANNEPKVVAIGEVGLDYGMAKSSHEQEIQRDIFKEFIDLSADVDLPLIVHTSKDAVADAIRMLKEKRRPAIMHGFQGSLEQAKEAISFGCMIAIWPTIIYAKYLQRLVRDLPLDSLAFETDSPLPFHAPIPGMPINEPANISITADKVAQIKGIPLEDVEEITTEGAKRFFRLSI